jgi:hypothetical protein
MSLSLVRGRSLVSLGLILIGFTASCSRPAAEGFRNVELTKEDLISVYEVPVAKKPAHKFEWNFRSTHYVRWLVERRDAPTGEWTLFQTWAYNLPCDQAYLLEQIDTNSRDRQTSQEWKLYLLIRTGGSSAHLYGSSDSTLALPMLRETFSTESHGDDPNKILIINSGPRSYRLRMEASEKPYAAY